MSESQTSLKIGFVRVTYKTGWFSTKTAQHPTILIDHGNGEFYEFTCRQLDFSGSLNMKKLKFTQYIQDILEDAMETAKNGEQEHFPHGRPFDPKKGEL